MRIHIRIGVASTPHLQCPFLNLFYAHINDWFIIIMTFGEIYRKVSNIRRTKSQNLNASRLILQLSLPNPLKPGVKLRMKI